MSPDVGGTEHALEATGRPASDNSIGGPAITGPLASGPCQARTQSAHASFWRAKTRSSEASEAGAEASAFPRTVGVRLPRPSRS